MCDRRARSRSEHKGIEERPTKWRARCRNQRDIHSLKTVFVEYAGGFEREYFF